jgi:hypothetical protein
MLVGGGELTQSQMTGEEIMGDPWPRFYCFFDILGLYCCVIDRKEQGVHPLTWTSLGRMWCGMVTLPSSANSVILLRG